MKGKEVIVMDYGMCFICKKQMYEVPEITMMNKDIGMIDQGYPKFEIKAHPKCIEVERLKKLLRETSITAYIRGREKMLSEIKENIYESINRELFSNIKI